MPGAPPPDPLDVCINTAMKWRIQDLTLAGLRRGVVDLVNGGAGRKSLKVLTV